MRSAREFMGIIIASYFAGDHIFIYENTMNTLRGHPKCSKLEPNLLPAPPTKLLDQPQVAGGMRVRRLATAMQRSADSFSP